MTIAWCLFAAAAWLGFGGGTRRRPQPAPTGRRRLSIVQLRVVAALGALTICVMIFGGLRGVLIGLLSAAFASEVVARAANRRSWGRSEPELPLVLDMLAGLLSSGQPLATGLELSASLAPPPLSTQLSQVGRMLRLGADPRAAWNAAADNPSLARVGATACRSAESGSALARSFTALAAELRADRTVELESRAQRVGVLLLAPLGLCFLPAFVCLGILPVVVGIASGVFPELH